MKITANQFVAIKQVRERDFVSRLDALLIPHSTAYAAAPKAQRLLALSNVTKLARDWGIREELNIGLFALLTLLFGTQQLQQPEPMAILQDPDRSGAVKVYQLWDWHRRAFPQEPIFTADQA